MWRVEKNSLHFPGKCERLKVSREEIFGVDKWGEPWVEQFQENGYFISIKNLAQFICVGITHRECYVMTYFLLVCISVFNGFLCFNRFEQKFKLNVLTVFVFC